MLPVVADVPALCQALMAGNNCISKHRDDLLGIEPDADHLARQLARHGVVVALHVDQAGAGYARRMLNVPVKCGCHRHHVGAFLFQHVGYAQFIVLGMVQFAP